ncbi:protein AAR2 homolog [Tetranychus urticae]|uniref:Protein AAR2 homolog n=1 Tax=Tetranychus urticae TaxID=32264 RepID=T1KF33_TETUR|nr:protein AAR2 homolog [Tetranychus urticae]
MSVEESPMDTLDIDQNTARDLLSEGGFFLLLDLPIGSSIGIDLSDYSVGEKFKGFKMIPPGLHFIHYSAVNSKNRNEIAPRTGLFHFFQPKEVIIRKWDGGNEDISSELLDADEFQRYQDNLIGSLDQHLAPYPFREYQRWINLTNYISLTVLEILNPICGKIKSVTEMISLRYPEDVQQPETSTSKRLTVDNLMPYMKVEPNSQIQFTQLSKLPKLPREAINPSDLTKHSIDQTYTLDEALKRYQHTNDILGELQFSFVTFIVGQVNDSFEQWKAMLKLLCASDQAISKYPSMYLNFIRVFSLQLKEVPEDIFVDIVDNENFLVSVLRDFFFNIFSNEMVDRKLKEAAERFKRQVTEKYKWDFEEEPEDECPVIVTMD